MKYNWYSFRYKDIIKSDFYRHETYLIFSFLMCLFHCVRKWRYVYGLG